MGMRRIRTSPRLAPRPLDAHKASVGRVLVVGGSRGVREGMPWMESVTAHVAANARADVVVARRPLARTSEVGPDQPT